MVTFADKSMLPQLVTLWQRSFGDSAEYIQMFLDWNFERIKTVVYVTEEELGIPASVAYLLPVTYMEKDKPDIPCWYLYAAATLPEYRGRGFFSEILKFVEERLSQPMILVPGEESLIAYYQKQGMHVWLKERKQHMAEKKSKDVPWQVCDISVEEYISMRNRLLSENTTWKQDGYMAWDAEFLQYICHENHYCGGHIKQIYFGEKQFLVMYRMENEVLKVLEVLPQTDIDACSYNLLHYMSDKKSTDSKTVCISAEVLLQPTVMATSKLKVEQEQGYFNLIMA